MNMQFNLTHELVLLNKLDYLIGKLLKLFSNQKKGKSNLNLMKNAKSFYLINLRHLSQPLLKMELLLQQMQVKSMMVLLHLF